VSQIVFGKFPLILNVAVLLFEPLVVPFGNVGLFCLSINVTTALNQLPGSVRTSPQIFLRDGEKQRVEGIKVRAEIYIYIYIYIFFLNS
jgi:hypothetical protein